MKPVNCIWCSALLQKDYALGITPCSNCGKIATTVITDNTTIKELAAKFAAETGVGVEVRIQGTEYGPIVAIVPVKIELEGDALVAIPTNAITWYKIQ